MLRISVLICLIVTPVVSTADLEVSGNQARMIGKAKWLSANFGTVSGVKWERAWLTKSSEKIFPLVYRGKVPISLSESELITMLAKIRKSILPESTKTITASEAIGREKVALNVAGAYLMQFKRQYVRLILGLVQPGRMLIMVAVVFAPNDKAAATQAKELMESFQFKGVRLFKVSLK